MRFIPWSGSAASTPQDRLRKCSLASVATAPHRHVPRAIEGQHHDRQRPESLGQKCHAPKVDRKSPKELLGVQVAHLVYVGRNVTDLLNALVPEYLKICVPPVKEAGDEPITYRRENIFPSCVDPH